MHGAVQARAGAAFGRILIAPKSRKPYSQLAGQTVWRILMARTEQHVYYTVDDAADEIINALKSTTIRGKRVLARRDRDVK